MVSTNGSSEQDPPAVAQPVTAAMGQMSLKDQGYHGTIKAAHPFDVEKDAEQYRKAMRGAGKEEL